ncbi:hypothetical protein BH11PLA2_BH11PLA2_01750 [soil metagenome]
MTASDLLKALSDAGVTVSMDAGKLRVSANVPEALGGPLAILQTGIRAILTGRPWYGYPAGAASWKDGASNPLSPSRLLPAGFTMLCVAGGKWNRIRPDLVQAHPELWDRPAARTARAVPQVEPATLTASAKAA